jgi:hypothetical protein
MTLEDRVQAQRLQVFRRAEELGVIASINTRVIYTILGGRVAYTSEMER